MCWSRFLLTYVLVCSKHFGSILTKDTSSGREIKARLQGASRSFHALNKLFSSRYVARKMELKLYNTLILPVILYGWQSLSTWRRDVNRIPVFEKSNDGFAYVTWNKISQSNDGHIIPSLFWKKPLTVWIWIYFFAL